MDEQEHLDRRVIQRRAYDVGPHIIVDRRSGRNRRSDEVPAPSDDRRLSDPRRDMPERRSGERRVR